MNIYLDFYAERRHRYDTPSERSKIPVNERNCLNCGNSVSLPAQEAFDDGTACDYDRLVCALSHEIVVENACCERYNY